MEQAIVRIPALETAPVRRHVNGPESFTPDGRYHLGEAPGVPELLRRRRLQLGGHRLRRGRGQGGGGVDRGRRAADGPVGRRHPPRGAVPGQPALPARPHGRDGRAALRHALALPAAGDGARRAHEPLHDRLAARGACFGETLGWERANWFAAPGTEPVYRYSWGRQNWFPLRRRGAPRRARGASACSTSRRSPSCGSRAPTRAPSLQRLCANDVDVPVGRIVYTQMLNRRGGIECDLTVTRLAEDAYLIVTGAAAATHDADWIRRTPGRRAAPCSPT